MYPLAVKFIIFVIDGPGNLALADEMEQIDLFNESLQAKGHWVMAAGISGPDIASIFDNRGNAGLKKSGSLFNEREHYSGFWIIEAESRKVAEDLAAQGSRACNRRVELRPFL